MGKITDIYEDLEQNIDIEKSCILNKIKTNSKKDNSTNDVIANLKNVRISKKKKIILEKNKTKNGDSFLKEERLTDIDLIKKNSLINKIKQVLKFKRTVCGKQISIFKKKKIITKGFMQKSLIIFAIFIGIGFINKIIIENRINSGYKKIISIKNNIGDINYIQKNINNAKVDFFIANFLYKPFLLIPNNNIKNGYFILKGGKELAEFIDESIYLYISVNNFIDSKKGLEDIEFTNLLSNISTDLSKITKGLYNTIVNYDNISDLGNEELNNKLFKAKEGLKFVYNFLDIINRDFDIFLGILGHNSEKTYIILFQNNDEIRATGGFIGSLATVSLKKGKVTFFEKKDVYAYEWDINKIYKNRLEPPKGINKITDHFGLRDSNYYPSFKDSSKSIKFFLDKIDKKVDGIIYINQNIILDLLKVTGGVEFADVEEIITENNFSIIISTLVEAQSFKVGTLGTPKQVLFNFTKVFIKKLKQDKNYSEYIKVLVKNIKSRDLVMYSFNSDENNLLWRLGLNGTINYSDTLDFSYPIYTSIGGNKSDRFIQLDYVKNITINNNCSISTDLNIKRTHLFSQVNENKINELLDKFPIKDKSREDIINIQGRGTNISYTRILLPKSAIVKKTKDITIKKEDTFTIVDIFMKTRVLESTFYNIKYTLPNTRCKEYSYKLYKQPGIKKYNLEINNSGKPINIVDISNDFMYK